MTIGKKGWYIEIIINSNLPKIDLFFKEALDAFKKSKIDLSKKYTSVTQKYAVEKAVLTKSINDKQNKLQFEIIPVFKSYDKKTAEDLNNILEEFRDYYTDNIGIETEKSTIDIASELEEIKSKFYFRLYKPVTKSFYDRILLERVLLWLLLITFVVLFLI